MLLIVCLVVVFTSLFCSVLAHNYCFVGTWHFFLLMKLLYRRQQLMCIQYEWLNTFLWPDILFMCVCYVCFSFSCLVWHFNLSLVLVLRRGKNVKFMEQKDGIHFVRFLLVLHAEHIVIHEKQSSIQQFIRFAYQNSFAMLRLRFNFTCGAVATPKTENDSAYTFWNRKCIRSNNFSWVQICHSEFSWIFVYLFGVPCTLCSVFFHFLSEWVCWCAKNNIIAWFITPVQFRFSRSTQYAFEITIECHTKMALQSVKLMKGTTFCECRNRM